jgi:hypothetical protein
MMNEKVMEARERTHNDEETYNEKDLLRLLDEFLGRRADVEGDTVEFASKRSIAAVGLFFVDVGWILRLDQSRYIHLPTDMELKSRSNDLALVSAGSNGTQVYEQVKSRRSRRTDKH